MGGSGGNVTNGNTGLGGSPEARGRLFLATTEAVDGRPFADRAQDVFTDFSETMVFPRTVIPNLGSSVELTDPKGVGFDVYALERDGKTSSISIETGRQRQGRLISYLITDTPLETSYKDETTGDWLRGEEALKAGKEKLEELLAPIKAAQAAREAAQSPDSRPATLADVQRLVAEHARTPHASGESDEDGFPIT